MYYYYYVEFILFKLFIQIAKRFGTDEVDKFQGIVSVVNIQAVYRLSCGL